MHEFKLGTEWHLFLAHFGKIVDGYFKTREIDLAPMRSHFSNYMISPENPKAKCYQSCQIL